MKSHKRTTLEYPDSRLVYIACHAMSILYALAIVCLVRVVAFQLEAALALVGILFVLRSYHHEHNRSRETVPGKCVKGENGEWDIGDEGDGESNAGPKKATASDRCGG